MKKKIRIIGLLLIVSVFGFLGFKIANKLSHKKEVTARTKTIPNFSFLDTKGNVYTKKTYLINLSFLCILIQIVIIVSQKLLK
jgi:hypothetical protein